MSASTGDVLYDRPFSFPSASIAFCRGRAKRDPSVGFVGNSPPLSASADSQKNAGLLFGSPSIITNYM